jgi:hypothetical protein
LNFFEKEGARTESKTGASQVKLNWGTLLLKQCVELGKFKGVRPKPSKILSLIDKRAKGDVLLYRDLSSGGFDGVLNGGSPCGTL